MQSKESKNQNSTAEQSTRITENSDAYLAQWLQARQDLDKTALARDEYWTLWQKTQKAWVKTHTSLTQTQKELNAANRHITELEMVQNNIVRSKAWRLSYPLRWFNSLAHKIFQKAHNLFIRTPKPKKMPLPNLPAAAKDSKPCTLNEDARRLAIYFFYDSEGIVDDYIPYLLNDLKKNVADILVVVNGKLTPDSKQKLSPYAMDILMRPNKGFDSWSYKEAMQHLGEAKMAQYDELVLCNFTFMGPVGSFRGMFDEMAQRPLDFWGITAHPGLPFDPSGRCPYDILPEHLQSYFIVFRKRLFDHAAFKQYWRNLPEIHNYNDAVALHEGIMTYAFEEAGFAWDTFINRDAYYKITDNPTGCLPTELIRDMNCPIFKRRSFFQDYDYFINFTGMQPSVTLYDYLNTQTDYPMDLLWDHLLRTCNMYSLGETLHLCRVLPDTMSNREQLAPIIKKKGVALVMYIYDAAMIEELHHYSASMPKDTDIYVSVTSPENKAAVENRFADLDARVVVRLAPNRGRDVTCLLVTFRDIVPNYEYICVTHDKTAGYLNPLTVGQGFAYKGYENILASQDFVYNIVDTFEREPRLGLLVVTGPNHADYTFHLGLEWGPNYPETKALAKKLGITAPMDEQHVPCAPYGSNFWFRSDALAPLLAKEWTYEDFPAEPFNVKDGSILHAIERIYPFAAQHAGYYTASLFAQSYYPIEYGNLLYYTQTFTQQWTAGLKSRFTDMRGQLNVRL